MKLKQVKSRKPGTCSASKCKAQATDLLCPEHEAAWRAEGAPVLEAPSTSLVPVMVQTRLANERHTAQECLDLIGQVPMDTDTDRERMTGFVRQAQDVIRSLEKERTDVVGPLNQAVKTINGWFKPVRDTYESIERAGKDRLKTAMLAAEQAQDAALARIQASGGTGSAETLVLAHATPELPAGVSTRDRWTFTVTNSDLVPREYWMLDMTKIGQDVRSQGAECSIPGIRIERDLSVSVRRANDQ